MVAWKPCNSIQSYAGVRSEQNIVLSMRSLQLYNIIQHSGSALLQTDKDTILMGSSERSIILILKSASNNSDDCRMKVDRFGLLGRACQIRIAEFGCRDLCRVAQQASPVRIDVHHIYQVS
jgi:hypothetical protein